MAEWRGEVAVADPRVSPPVVYRVLLRFSDRAAGLVKAAGFENQLSDGPDIVRLILGLLGWPATAPVMCSVVVTLECNQVECVLSSVPTGEQHCVLVIIACNDDEDNHQNSASPNVHCFWSVP